MLLSVQEPPFKHRLQSSANGKMRYDCANMITLCYVKQTSKLKSNQFVNLSKLGEGDLSGVISMSEANDKGLTLDTSN